MEKLITKITDNDFGLKFCDMEKPQLRKGARGISNSRRWKNCNF